MSRIFIMIIFLCFFQNSALTNAPFDKKNIKFIYQLKDKKIYVVETETLDLIYEFNEKNKRYNKINKIYNFVGFAEKCRVVTIDKELTDVFAGTLRLYYLDTGGYESELLLFKINQKKLTQDNSIGAFSSVNEFKQQCKLYKSLR